MGTVQETESSGRKLSRDKACPQWPMLISFFIYISSLVLLHLNVVALVKIFKTTQKQHIGTLGLVKWSLPQWVTSKQGLKEAERGKPIFLGRQFHQFDVYFLTLSNLSSLCTSSLSILKIPLVCCITSLLIFTYIYFAYCIPSTELFSLLFPSIC